MENSKSSPHINEWTGRPCNCSMGGKHRTEKTAGSKTDWVLKQPDKAFQTPEGKAFREALPGLLGDEYDGLAPYLANRWKKGDLQYNDPSEYADDYSTPPPLTYQPPGMARRPVLLDQWNQWYNAKQHPTRRGVNIMDPDFTPERFQHAVEEHQRHIENEHLLKGGLAEGETVKKFPNGWTVHHLNAGNSDIESAMEAEGCAMGHCIGSEDQPYKDAALNQGADVYSLRDKQGFPHGTWIMDPDGEVAEIHGNDNRALSPEQQAMYEAWAEDNGVDPHPTGYVYRSEDEGDDEIEIPGAETIDEFKDHQHPDSDNEYYEQAYDYGNRGEDTEIYTGSPRLESVAQDLIQRGDTLTPQEREDFYNTIAYSGYAEAFRKELAELGDSEYLAEFDKNYLKHFSPEGFKTPEYNWRGWKMDDEPVAQAGWTTQWDRTNVPLWQYPQQRKPEEHGEFDNDYLNNNNPPRPVINARTAEFSPWQNGDHEILDGDGFPSDPWVPGDYGKGVIAGDKIHTWSTYDASDPYRGEPHHLSVLEGLGESIDPTAGVFPFHIDPEGNVSTWNGEIDPRYADHIRKHTDLKIADDTQHPEWKFGSDDEDGEEDFDEDQYLEDEGWLTPHPIEPLVNNVEHHKNWGDHYEVEEDPDDEYDDEYGEQNERPVIFDGQQFHVGQPNAYHWDLIEALPQLRDRVGRGERNAPDGGDSIAMGRYHPGANTTVWPNKGMYRRDHFNDLVQKAFPGSEDIGSDMGFEDNNWVFGAVKIVNGGQEYQPATGGYDDAEPWELGEHGKGGYKDGVPHLWAIDSFGDPHHDWVIDGRGFHVNPEGLVESWGSDGQEASKEFAEHHPDLHVDDRAGWSFSKTASKMEWLEERPDKFRNTEDGAFAFKALKKAYDQDPKIDPITPWLWRELKKGRIDWEMVLQRREMSHLADWFASKSPTRKGVDIMQKTWDDIEGLVDEWDQELADKEAEANDHNGKVVHQFDNGWTMRELAPEDLPYEGECMGHCVGGSGYDQAVASGQTVIYSLRDQENTPHGTVEIQNQSDGPRLEQVQGQGNTILKPEYQAMVKEFFNTLEAKPTWAGEDSINDIDEIQNPEFYQDNGDNGWGGYGPHGDYGIERGPRSLGYDNIFDTMMIRGRGGNVDYVDHGAIRDLYDHAVEVGKVPELERALQDYQENTAWPSLMDLHEQNYDYLNYPGEEWDEAEGRFESPEEFQQAREEYEEAEKDLENNHAPSQLVNGLYDYLNHHHNPETNEYGNEKWSPEKSTQPTVFSNFYDGPSDESLEHHLNNLPSEEEILGMLRPVPQRGKAQKGLELPDGTRYFWTPNIDAFPHHQDVAQALGVKRVENYLDVLPDGKVINSGDFDGVDNWSFG